GPTPANSNAGNVQLVVQISPSQERGCATENCSCNEGSSQELPTVRPRDARPTLNFWSHSSISYLDLSYSSLIRLRASRGDGLLAFSRMARGVLEDARPSSATEGTSPAPRVCFASRTSMPTSFSPSPILRATSSERRTVRHSCLPSIRRI